MRRIKLKSWFKYLLISLGIVLFDQIVKVLIKQNMHLGEEYLVFGEWFKIHFIENQGAAFGMTLKTLIPSMSDITAKAILSVFSIGAVGLIIYILYTIRDAKTKLPLLVAFILGGAVGNIIDRLFYGMIFDPINDYEGGFLHGRVVDMFYLDIWQGVLPEWIPIWGGQYTALWPIFNIADAAISVGITAIIIFQNKLFTKTAQPSETIAPEIDHLTDTPGINIDNSDNKNYTDNIDTHNNHNILPEEIIKKSSVGTETEESPGLYENR